MQTPDSAKVRGLLPGWYRDLHAEGKFPGDTFHAHLPALAALLGERTGLSVLDFGCGPRGGLASVPEFPHTVRGYDPYVPAFADDPWSRRYDVVFSSDALEHLLVPQLATFLDDVAAASPWLVFLAVATRSASKTFPNGLNVHLIVEPASWWLGYVQARLPGYKVVRASEDLLTGVVEVALTR